MDFKVSIFGASVFLKNIVIAAILSFLSLAMFLSDHHYGIIKVISTVPLFLLAIRVRSDLAACFAVAAGCIACFFSPPFFAISYLLYVVAFSAFMNINLNRATKQGAKHICVTRMALGFFSITIFAGFFAMSFFEGISSRKFFSEQFLWLNDVIVFLPGVMSFFACLISVISAELFSKFSKGARISSPLAFSPSAMDYFWLAACIAGSIFLPAEEKIVFVNMLIFATLPFIIDGARFMVYKMKIKSVPDYILWVMSFVFVLPVVALAICSLLQPWIKYKGWSYQKKRCGNGGN